VKKKILWLGLSFLLVAALVLVSCGPTVPVGEQEEEEEVLVPRPPGTPGTGPGITGEQEEEEEEVVPAAGEPVYGGTITAMYMGSNTQAGDPPSPDELDSQYLCTHWLKPIQEGLMWGDIEKCGSEGRGGSGFHPFLSPTYIPDDCLTGRLVESWDILPDKVIFTIRHGVHWAPTEKQSAWMEPREVTVDDIVADIKMFVGETPWGNRFDDKIVPEGIYKIDEDTFAVEFLQGFSPDICYYFSWEDRSLTAPPELHAVEGRAARWENQVGTGPFMFEEYVPGSHMSYTANPNWYVKAHINGKEYQLPFVDELIFPIIPEAATQIAALRSGTLDFLEYVPVTEWEMLERTSPGLVWNRYSQGGAVAAPMTREPPFDNVNVRRALMIGTDMTAIEKFTMAEGAPIYWEPILPQHPAYVPLEEQPPEIQILYHYNPELAKEMLADEGYPNGFKTTLNITSMPVNQDMAALLADQWGKIGIDVEINALEPVVYSTITYDKNFHGISCSYSGTSGGENMNIPVLLFKMAYTGGWNNDGDYSNPALDELVDKMMTETDRDEIIRLEREAAYIYQNEAVKIPLSPIVGGHAWWPWLKNYYGEVCIADSGIGGILSYAWVDQVLKAKMGY